MKKLDDKKWIMIMYLFQFVSMLLGQKIFVITICVGYTLLLMMPVCYGLSLRKVQHIDYLKNNLALIVLSLCNYIPARAMNSVSLINYPIIQLSVIICLIINGWHYLKTKRRLYENNR